MSSASGKPSTRNNRTGKDAKSLILALQHAEAALADIGDADREPGDDVKWCEDRAAEVLPIVRKALDKVGAKHSGLESYSHFPDFVTEGGLTGNV